MGPARKHGNDGRTKWRGISGPRLTSSTVIIMGIMVLIGLTALTSCSLPFISSRPTSHPTSGRPTATPTGDILVGANVNVSHWPGSQDEVSAAVDPADPSILLAGSNSLQYDPSVRVYGSTDAGLHWTSDLLPLPTTAKTTGAVDQWVAIGPDHRQAMAYLTFGNTPSPAEGSEFGGLTLFVATRDGPEAAWQSPSAPVGGLPPQGSYDDKTALAFDNSSTSAYHGRLYVAWTRWVGDDGSLLISYSTDAGHTWAAPQALSHQGPNWGAALAIAADGSVTVAWVGADHLWIARSQDGGQHFSSSAAFGDCAAPMASCVADVPAQTDAGVRPNPVLVQVPASAGQRAQVLAFFTDGDGTLHTRIQLAHFDAASLQPLGSPATVPLGAAGTDAFLPAAAYDPSKQTLWACAYVSLANTPAETRYTCAASRDGGAHFLPPTAIASATSNEEQPGAFRNFIGRQYGDYTDLVAADGAAHAFWTDSRTLTLEEEIYTASLHLAPGVGATG